MKFFKFLNENKPFIFFGSCIIVMIIIISILPRFVNLNQTYQEKICSNLDNNGSVYKEVLISKLNVEQSLNLNVVEMYANSSTPRTWDEEGVMCQMDVELCEKTDIFCMNIRMIIPVNYVEWEDWYLYTTIKK